MERYFRREYLGVRSRIVDRIVEIEQWLHSPPPHEKHGDYPRAEDCLLW